MDYNSEKLGRFCIYLKEADAHLYDKVDPLGISQEGKLSCHAEFGVSYLQEDWDNLMKYWQKFKATL